jgi:sulfur relay (sulfurtransferase) complex TusBCD TusD component (DsrE family)
VKACVVCIKARGIAESELVSGVKVVALNDLVEWTATSDKVIVF